MEFELGNSLLLVVNENDLVFITLGSILIYLTMLILNYSYLTCGSVLSISQANLDRLYVIVSAYYFYFLITLFLLAFSCGQLQKLVVENILAFNETFWIRLAARRDTCKSDDDKARFLSWLILMFQYYLCVLTSL